MILILFLSCQTAQKKTGEITEKANFLPLESGASVYVIADVKKSQPILELLPLEELKNKQVRQMMEKTDTMAAAFFPPESGRRFQIAARGNYPSARAGFAFGFNKQWKKQHSGDISYWYSAANGLSIALNPKEAFAAASTKNNPLIPVTPAPGIEIPEGFHEFGIAPLSLWLDDPAPLFNRLMAGIPIRFPVQELFLNLHIIDENRFDAGIRLKFENTSQARGLAAILALASGFAGEAAPPLASILLANPPVQEGVFLDFKTAVMNKAEITLLLESIFIYLK